MGCYGDDSGTGVNRFGSRYPAKRMQILREELIDVCRCDATYAGAHTLGTDRMFAYMKGTAVLVSQSIKKSWLGCKANKQQLQPKDPPPAPIAKS